MRELSQRFWDAMIIKSWQDFDNCDKLNAWAFQEFGDYPMNLDLKRVKNCYPKMGVRVWVDTYMPQLSEKLFALPKNRHIELLDWLGKSSIDSIYQKRSKGKRFIAEITNSHRNSRIKAIQTIVSKEIEKGYNRNNQWSVVK